MIRLNLLAEEIAAEEMRRHDPVKRAIWVAAFLVSLVLIWVLTLQAKVMQVNSSFDSTQTQWKYVEKQDTLIKSNLLKTAEMERRLKALAQLSTNRFPWCKVLNALQFSMVDSIQVTEINVSQKYELVVPKTDSTGKKTMGPATSIEKVSMILRGDDFAPDSEGNHTRFMEAIAKNPFFQLNLKKPDPFKAVERTRGAEGPQELVVQEPSHSSANSRTRRGDMTKLPKEKRDQLILIVVATLLICGALWHLVIGAQQETIRDQTKKLTEMTQRLETARALAKKGEKYESDLKAMRERLATAEVDMLPPGNEYTTLFKILKSAVANTPVEFVGDLSQPTIADTDLLPDFPYKSASFVAILFGRYHQVGSFLAGFRARYPYIRAELVSVRRPDVSKPEDGEKLRFEIKVIVLVQSNLTK